MKKLVLVFITLIFYTVVSAQSFSISKLILATNYTSEQFDNMCRVWQIQDVSESSATLQYTKGKSTTLESISYYETNKIIYNTYNSIYFDNLKNQVISLKYKKTFSNVLDDGTIFSTYENKNISIDFMKSYSDYGTIFTIIIKDYTKILKQIEKETQDSIQREREREREKIRIEDSIRLVRKKEIQDSIKLDKILNTRRTTIYMYDKVNITEYNKLKNIVQLKILEYSKTLPIGVYTFKLKFNIDTLNVSKMYILYSDSVNYVSYNLKELLNGIHMTETYIDGFNINAECEFVFNIEIQSFVIKVKNGTNKDLYLNSCPNTDVFNITQRKGKYLIENYQIKINNNYFNFPKILNVNYY